MNIRATIFQVVFVPFWIAYVLLFVAFVAALVKTVVVYWNRRETWQTRVYWTVATLTFLMLVVPTFVFMVRHQVHGEQPRPCAGSLGSNAPYSCMYDADPADAQAGRRLHDVVEHRVGPAQPHAGLCVLAGSDPVRRQSLYVKTPYLGTGPAMPGIIRSARCTPMVFLLADWTAHVLHGDTRLARWIGSIGTVSYTAPPAPDIRPPDLQLHIGLRPGQVVGAPAADLAPTADNVVPPKPPSLLQPL